MAILRLGRFVPRSIREWDAIFRGLNEVISEDENGTVTVDADNLPPQDAAYLTLSNNASLTADRVLTPTVGELVGTDGGPATTYTLGLADTGTPGEYPVVTTDVKGRVTAGRALAETDIPAEITRDTELAAHADATTDVHSEADYAQTDVAETITAGWKFDETITLSKTSGKGIKLDTAAPTFPWHDLLGAISIRGTGATDPSYNVYAGGIRGYQFDAGEEVFIEFHLPHDYLPGSDLFIHFHHSINGKTTAGVTGGTVNGGTTTWGAEVSYAKGHNQAAFSTPITTTVQSTTTAATLLQHYITEVQLSAASPSASQLDSDLIEVDGLLLVRAYLSSNDITVASGATPAPFLHFVDVHYQSTGVGTKQKAPPFWT